MASSGTAPIVVEQRRGSVLIGGSTMFPSDRQLLLGDQTEKLSYGTLTTESNNSSSLEFFDGARAWRKGYRAGKKVKKQTTLGIFSYSTALDYVLILLGTFASVLHGAGFPLLSIVLGGMTSVFLRAENSEFAHGETPPHSTDANGTGNAAIRPISQEEFQHEVILYSVLYLLLGAIMFITSYVQIACWEAVAERVVHTSINKI